MIAATTSTAVPVAWLVARAAGLTALALLSASLWLGLAMSVRLLAPRRQKSLMGWHQTLMWCGLSMVALHGIALLLDPVMHFSIAVVLVPGLAPWRPLAVSAGVVAAWLMLALASSFHVRRRITQRRWRLIHYAGFAAFALALGHGLTAGTDLRGLTGLIVAGGLAAPAVWLVYARILVPRPQPAAPAGRRRERHDARAASGRASRPWAPSARSPSPPTAPSTRRRGSRSPPRGTNCAPASGSCRASIRAASSRELNRNAGSVAAGRRAAVRCAGRCRSAARRDGRPLRPVDPAGSRRTGLRPLVRAARAASAARERLVGRRDDRARPGRLPRADRARRVGRSRWDRQGLRGRACAGRDARGVARASGRAGRPGR